MSNYVLIDGTLYHHGIQGQKWGTRRWQNEDGSLTPEGREHYGYGAKAEYKNRIGIAKAKYKKGNEKWNNRLDELDKKGYTKLSKKEKKEFNDLSTKIADHTKKSLATYRKEIKQAKQEYRNSEEYKQTKDKAKKIAIAGAAVVGAALVAYGTYKYVEATKDKAYKVSYKKGSEAASRIMADVGMNKSMDYKTFSNAYKGFSENIAKTAENNSKNFITSIKYLKGKGGQKSSAELARQGISTVNYGPYSEYMDKALDLYRNGINEDYVFGKKR